MKTEMIDFSALILIFETYTRFVFQAQRTLFLR